MINFNNEDTIVAIATPPGKSAIGIIRLSGSKAIDIVNPLFPSKDLSFVESHTLHIGTIRSQKGLILDEVCLSVFRAPRSYTGENLVEISCHGSMFILNSMLDLLTEMGARPAGPGEFSFRAFMNHKLDLSQLEAVADVIDAENKSAHRIAVNQMRGGFSAQLQDLRDRLLNLASLFELELDFAEEDVEFATTDQLNVILTGIKIEVEKLTASFKLGNVLKKGVAVVIAGRPNAGKSTLLNTLLNDERAITSHIPGTTRDFIEDSITIEGIEFRFIDTAGITDAKDEIEKEGIKRTRAKVSTADIVIYLFDINKSPPAEVEEDLKILGHKSHIIMAANKTDLVEEGKMPYLQNEFNKVKLKPVYLSSKFHQHIDELKAALIDKLDLEAYRGDQSIVSNVRHYKLLKDILASLGEIDHAIKEGLTKDLIAIDVHRTLDYIGLLTGSVTNEELLGNIFGRFCIGK
jgi:tRNA modification GTPase